MEVRPAEGITDAEQQIPGYIPNGVSLTMTVTCLQHSDDDPDQENENLAAYTWTYPVAQQTILTENGHIRQGDSQEVGYWTGQAFSPLGNHLTELSWHGNAGNPGTIYILRGTLQTHIWDPGSGTPDGPGYP